MEIKRDWDIDALCDAHEILDMREDAERQAMAEAQRQHGGT